MARGQRRHRWCRFAAGAARWLMLLQTPGGKARPITAAARAVEVGVSERTLYRDIAELTTQGAPIYGVEIAVLQVVGRRIETEPQFGTP